MGGLNSTINTDVNTIQQLYQRNRNFVFPLDKKYELKHIVKLVDILRFHGMQVRLYSKTQIQIYNTKIPDNPFEEFCFHLDPFFAKLPKEMDIEKQYNNMLKLSNDTYNRIYAGSEFM